MLKALSILLALLSLSCTPVTKLEPINSKRTISFDEHYIKVSNRGIGVIWVEGLKAGTYIEKNKDSRGSYFWGEGDSSIVLFGKPAIKYLKSINIDIQPFYDDKKKIGQYWLNNDDSTKLPAGPTYFGASYGGIFVPHTNYSNNPSYLRDYAGFFVIKGAGESILESFAENNLGYFIFGNKFINKLAIK